MRFIDLRSDTVTMPTDEMREAMFRAEVGDDVYGDDPTTKRLEQMAADMLGKEAGLFVTSGTMGNQLSIMSHTRPTDEVILGEEAHIVVHEVGAAALLSSVNLRTVKNESGTVDPADIKRLFRPVDIHVPRTGLVCMENALANGTVVPLSHMKEVYGTAKEYGLPVHLDGARIFNAAAALQVDVKEIAACADSVTFCLSKGLCAPVGSVIVGDRDFIERARKNRKLLGGGLRQCGFLAAAGIVALEKMVKRLPVDHANAKYLAEQLLELGEVELDLKKVQINMVFFRFTRKDFPCEKFESFMLSRGVKMNGYEGESEYRFVTNHDVTRDDLDVVIYLIKSFLLTLS